MRYFLDTEFIEDGQSVELLSIGIVAEDGREFYAENLDCNTERANDWVKANVLPQLEITTCPDGQECGGGYCCAGDERETIARDVREFCDPEKYGRPEFWTDCGAFDYVALSNLFGGMAHWPEGWPYYFNDLQQQADQLGTTLLCQPSGQHHALEDARWAKEMYDHLALQVRPGGWWQPRSLARVGG